MDRLIRVILLAIAAILFGAGINLGYRDLVGAQAGCFAAGVAILIFVFLSQFKRFKGPFGIEGEMWEQEMEEAQEITQTYRNLATVVAKPLITNSMRMGRWSSGLTRREVDEMVRDVRSILKNAGTPPEQIEEALSDYRKYTAFDLVRPARKVVKYALDAKVSETRKALEAFGGRVEPDQNEAHNAAAAKYRAASESAKRAMEAFDISKADKYPELIRSSIRECELLDEKERTALLDSVQDILDDLAYFRANGKIRRPDVWFNEDDK